MRFIYLVIALVLSTVLQLFLLGQQLASKIALTNTLDFSWMSDSVERFLHGYIAGRDYIITFGPLFQFIYSLPALIFKIPSYSSFLFASILLTIISGIFLYIITKLVTKNKKDHTILFLFLFIFINLFSFPDAHNFIRIIVPFFYSLHLIKNISVGKNTNYLKHLLLSLLPAIFGLYIFDLFLTCLMLTIGITLFQIIFYFYNGKKLLRNLQIKQYLFLSVLQIGLIVSVEIIVSLLLSNNLNYLIYSFNTITDYQFIENIPWSINGTSALLIFPLLLLFVAILVLRSQTLDKSTKMTFIVLIITALLGLKTGIIRSDAPHILTGIYPSIFALIIIGYTMIAKKELILIMFFITYLVLPNKIDYTKSFSSHYLSLASSLLWEKKSFFEIYTLPNNYYYTKNDFQYFSSLIKKNKNTIMVYPYDTYILNIYGQTYNTLPLQFYDYSNSLVEKRAVEKLEQSPPKFIILGIDTRGALALDNIPNFSRNPLIAKWMLSNYSVYKNQGNYLVLNFNQKKKLLSQNLECRVYNIDTSKVTKSSLIEKVFKPSFFYLNSITFRLPYTYNMKNSFIIDDYSNADKLEKLFNRGFDFDKHFTQQKKNFTIIKKYPIPKLKKIYDNSFVATCY